MRSIEACWLAYALGCALNAQTIDVLHSFSGYDGMNPVAGLIQAQDGAFYGTARSGGATSNGTVFCITMDGHFRTVLSFGGTNGDQPSASLSQAVDGSLYGTTYLGGRLDLNNGRGFGTVFRASTGGGLTTLARFDGTNGTQPLSRLILSGPGFMYGTTQGGGASGYGTVFMATTNSTLTTLVSFAWTNGAYPPAGLVQGKDGAFYGTTSEGGLGSAYYGTVFRVTQEGALTTLASNIPDPTTALLLADDGNLYGATDQGAGIIFKISQTGAWTTVASLGGDSPFGTLIQGRDDRIYGTTSMGGGYGDIFQLTTNAVYRTLAAFNNQNGRLPVSELIQGTDGNLYGTTEVGGTYDLGTVFRLTFPTLTASRVGQSIVLSWPTNPVGFSLEYSLELPSTNWYPFGSAILSGDRYWTTNCGCIPQQLFRLRK